MGFHSDRDVEIKIVVDDSDANQKLKDIQKNLDTLSNTKFSFGDQVKEFADSFNSGVVAGFTKEAEKAGVAIEDLGEEIKTSNISLKDFIKGFFSFGEAAGGADGGPEKAKQGFSSLQAAIITANQAIELGIKAFRTLSRAATSLFDALADAQRVEGLTRAFDNLQVSIGRDSVQAIGELRSATQGLISDLDLFQAANNAVILGVDDGTGKFNDLAAAAIKLGQATGRTATQALNDLTTGIGRQSKLILDNLGIIVNAESAYETYAASINKVTKELTDQERRLAFNAAAFKAINDAAAKLSQIQETASVSAQRLTVTLSNQRNAFLESLSANTNLQTALITLNEAFLDIDVTQLADDVARVAAIFIDMASAAIPAIVGALADFNRGVQTLNQTLLNIISLDPGKFFSDLGDNIAQAIRSISLTEIVAGGGSIGGALGIAIGQGAATTMKGALVQGAKDAAKLAGTQTAQAFKTSLEKAVKIAKIEDVLAAPSIAVLKELEGAFRDFERAIEAGIPITNAQATAMGELGVTIFELREALKKTRPTLDDFGDGAEEVTEKFQDLCDIFTKQEDCFEQAGQDITDIGAAMGGLNAEADAAGVAVKDLGTDVEVAAAKAADAAKRFEQDFARDIGRAVSVTLGLVLSGESFSDIKEDIGRSLGGAAGSAIGRGLGETLGGPIGAEIGDAIGREMGAAIGENISEIGDSIGDTVTGVIDIAFPGTGTILAALGAEDVINKVFGESGGEPNRLSRDNFQEFFNKLIEETEFDSLFFGEDGFNVSREAFNPIIDEFGNVTTEIEQQLADLNIPDDLLNQFLDLGSAFAQVFDFAEEGLEGIAGQFGQILAVSLQDPLGLNELQLLLQRAGVTAETFKQALEDAFFTGEISARDFQAQVAATNDIFAEGIPGIENGIEAITLAFEKFITTGLVSGQRGFDGLRDIAVEASQAGVETFEQLEQVLIANGASAEDVAVLFEVLAAQGITTVDALANINLDQTAAIITGLEDTGFAFVEIGEDIDAVIGKIENFREEATQEIITNYKIIVSVEGDVEEAADLAENNGGPPPPTGQQFQ